MLSNISNRRFETLGMQYSWIKTRNFTNRNLASDALQSIAKKEDFRKGPTTAKETTTGISLSNQAAIDGPALICRIQKSGGKVAVRPLAG